MVSNDLEELFGSRSLNIAFTRRNDAIPGDLRISWRLTVVCLLLGRFRADRARSQHLHTLWWAIRSRSSRDLIVRWFEGRPAPDEIIVRFDPSLATTIDLAVGQGLVGVERDGTLKLAASGKGLADSVWADDRVLLDEKSFLEKLPRRISQRAMTEMTEWK